MTKHNVPAGDEQCNADSGQRVAAVHAYCRKVLEDFIGGPFTADLEAWVRAEVQRHRAILEDWDRRVHKVARIAAELRELAAADETDGVSRWAAAALADLDERGIDTATAGAPPATSATLARAIDWPGGVEFMGPGGGRGALGSGRELTAAALAALALLLGFEQPGRGSARAVHQRVTNAYRNARNRHGTPGLQRILQRMRSPLPDALKQLRRLTEQHGRRPTQIAPSEWVLLEGDE